MQEIVNLCVVTTTAFQRCFVGISVALALLSCSASAESLRPSASVDASPVTMAITEFKPPYILGSGKTGIEVDIALESLALAGLTLEPIFLPQRRAKVSYERRETDGLITVNESLALPGYLTKSTIQYHNHAIALQSRNFQIQNFEDLRGKALVAFPNAHIYLASTLGAVIKSASRYEEVPNQLLQAKMLLAGRTDVAIADKRIFRWFAGQAVSEGQERQALAYFPIYAPTSYYNIFHDEQIRDAFNLGLDIIKRNGRYQDILTGYSSPLAN